MVGWAEVVVCLQSNVSLFLSCRTHRLLTAWRRDLVDDEEGSEVRKVAAL